MRRIELTVNSFRIIFNNVRSVPFIASGITGGDLFHVTPSADIPLPIIHYHSIPEPTRLQSWRQAVQVLDL